MSIIKAFEKFMQEAFEDACLSSTEAGWSGGHFCVELFDDESYRVLYSGMVGNLYDSKGMILLIPSLSEDEYDDDPDICFFDNAEQAMRDIFEEKWKENLAYQNAIASII